MVKYKILDKLRISKDYLSGQAISKELGISRTAIWKHVNSLRREGYVIEASSRKGYLLKRVPDLLLPQELERVLETRLVGRKIVHFHSLESTINIAKNLKRDDDSEEGTVVIAERQTAGRGRFGRSWTSPKGGIWLSVILAPTMDPIEAPKLNVASSMSIVNTLEEFGLKPKVKWPNDVIVAGRKIAGVLIEMSAELDRINYVIISMGINANNSFSNLAELAGKVTTIKEETGKKVGRIDFTAKLLANLEKNYSKLFDNHSKTLLQNWKALCVTIGQPVAVKTVSGVVKGKAVDVDEYGRLIVVTPEGQTKTLSSGEATIKNFPSDR